MLKSFLVGERVKVQCPVCQSKDETATGNSGMVTATMDYHTSPTGKKRCDGAGTEVSVVEELKAKN